MAQIQSIQMPDLTISMKINVPRGYRVRLAIMSWCIALAGFVAPASVTVDADIKAG